MGKLRTIHPGNTTGKVKELFELINNHYGMIPNFMRTMANSPVVLESYLSLLGTLGKGLLPARLREQIALVVSQINESVYCLAAHSAIGRTAGLSDEEILDSRKGVSPDSKVEAALSFARLVIEKKGQVSFEDISRLTRVGYSEGEIAEMVATIVLTIFTNYFNLVAGTDIDFPEVPNPSSGSY